jgi:hypothetical protein
MMHQPNEEGSKASRLRALLELPTPLKINVLFGIPVSGIDGPITEQDKNFLRDNLTPEEQHDYSWAINRAYF